MSVEGSGKVPHCDADAGATLGPGLAAVVPGPPALHVVEHQRRLRRSVVFDRRKEQRRCIIARDDPSS